MERARATTKSCIVTGGAGFIGSHLCEALVSLGHNVICVDNLLTGAHSNIEGLLHQPNFKFIQYDVTRELPILGHVDYLFHLASPASVIDYQNLPEETALVNSFGTYLLLKYVKANKAKFLFASTSEIYGDPKEHPQKETYWGNVNPNGVRACYDEAKRYGEMMTMLYVRKYGVDARIVRIFNTYGPRMRKNDGRVISNFVNQALKGEAITVYGDGTQTRSFCYVDDLVGGMIQAMFKGKSGEVFNLGNPEEYRMIDLAQKIKKMTESRSPIVHKDLPLDDPTRRCPDITKAKKMLGWTPTVSVEEGLKRTIAYYQKQ